MLSENDLFRLEQARFARLRELVDLPQQCVQHLDLDCSLSIVATNQGDSEALLEKRELLQAIAYRVLGTRELSLWFNHKSVWHGETLFSSSSVQDSGLELESTTELEEVSMGTATIDRDAIAATTRTELNETVNAQIDEVIQQEVRAVLDESSLQQRVRERLTLFLGQASGSFNGTTNGAVATMEPPAKTTTGRKATAKRSTKSPTKPAGKSEPKATALKLPRGFATQVSNRYKQVIEKFLPEGDDRELYLEAVCNETAEGKEWLMKIATAISKKYKNLEPDKAYQGLLDNAQKL